MGMFVVAPAASFNHHHGQHDAAALNLAAAAGDPMNSSNATALGVGVGVGVIPLLTAAPCLAAQNMDDQDFLNNGRSKISGIQFWQNQPAQYNNNIKKTTASVFDHNHSSANLLSAAAGGAIGGNSNSGSSGTTTCLDCGNQAKKDCSHRRCRTCCKSRGYDCSTHVKSTWVPAARRRERQLMAAAGGSGGGSGAACSTGSSSGAKKPRLTNTQTTASHTSTSNATTPRSFETSSSNQGFDASFKEGLPRQVRAPAVFKCVKVTAVDDGEDEYAYQAVVKIGGHVFKGFLYDQGQCFPNISELHLGGGEGGRNGASSSAPIMDPDNPADLYGGSGGGGLLASSTAYGNPMN